MDEFGLLGPAALFTGEGALFVVGAVDGVVEGGASPNIPISDSAVVAARDREIGRF